MRRERIAKKLIAYKAYSKSARKQGLRTLAGKKMGEYSGM